MSTLETGRNVGSRREVEVQAVHSPHRVGLGGTVDFGDEVEDVVAGIHQRDVGSELTPGAEAPQVEEVARKRRFALLRLLQAAADVQRHGPRLKSLDEVAVDCRLPGRGILWRG